MKALAVILGSVIVMALNWAITVGVIYLICLCFSWNFSLLIATGIWLILNLIRSLISKGG